MDLVPDDVVSYHLLPLLSFRDAFCLYYSCRRFCRLLSVRLGLLLDVLSAGGDVYEVLRRALEGGLADLVEFLVDESGFSDREWGMFNAAKWGHLDIVEYFVGRGASDWNRGMCGAAMGARPDLIEYFVGMGASGWDKGMCSAAQGGHMDVVEDFIERGASDWEWGMCCAAEGGHRDLVDYFVGMGASDWDRGMGFATWGGHRDLVEYFERKRSERDR